MDKLKIKDILQQNDVSRNIYSVCVEPYMVKLFSLLFSHHNPFANCITNKVDSTLSAVQDLTYVTYFTNHIVTIINR